MSWWVYILRCADDSLYTGITTDLQRRLAEHNGEQPGGARYTSARRPVKILWHEAQPSRSEATRRELEIKGMTRGQKEKLSQESSGKSTGASVDDRPK